MLKELGVRYLSVKEFHLPYNDPPEVLAQGRRQFNGGGLQILSGGVVVTREEDQAALDRYFQYAKACGMPMLVMMPSARQLPRIERLVQEYNIRVAVHNHGPEDKNFPTPESAYAMVKKLDPRIGLCIDVGHTARTGEDVVRSIDRCRDRLIDMHIKDLRDLRGHTDCEVGRGVLPIVPILRLLVKLRYQGDVALEYEADPQNPLPGMRASLAFLRGALAGLAG